VYLILIRTVCGMCVNNNKTILLRLVYLRVTSATQTQHFQSITFNEHVTNVIVSCFYTLSRE